MQATEWDIGAIREALGGKYTASPPDTHAVRLTNEELGIRVKVELVTGKQLVRLWCDRHRTSGPTFVGRTDLFRVTAIEADSARGEVRFRTDGPSPSELLVTEDGTFTLKVAHTTEMSTDESHPMEHDVTAKECEEPSDELVNLVGKLARPHYSERTGKPFFSAGLAQYPHGAMAPVWHNLKAFGGVARAAQHLERGQMVRVSGKQQEETYEREGEAQSALSLLVVHIEAADVNPASGAAGRQDHGRGQTDEPRGEERMRHASSK